MRIVYIITRSDIIGGAQVHVRDLAWHLLQAGHDVTVLVGGKGPFTEELARRGIPYRSLAYLVRRVNPCIDMRGLFELRHVLAGLQPHLVSAHSSKAGWLGRLAASSIGLPVVFTAHGWPFADGTPGLGRRFYAFAERIAASCADRIITVSEYDRCLALRYRIAPAQKVVVIHNGMPDVDRTLFARPEVEPVRIVMVARFEPQKDHATLIRALAGLRDLAWELDLIGDGPLLDRVVHEVERRGLRRRVRFLGACNDVAERLAEAQIFVLASNWEGLPRSILEAMRAGLPVVASDVGGVREAVRDNETGFLFPRGDEAALGSCLRKLITTPSLRVALGQAGRRRFEEYFTFGRMLEQTLAVYEDVSGVRFGRNSEQYVGNRIRDTKDCNLS